MLKKVEIVKEYNCYQYRARTKFTWLPKQLDDGYSVFLSFYIVIEKLCYPRQDLPLHIKVPDQPFWIEVKSLELPIIPVDTRDILDYTLRIYLEDLSSKNIR